MAAPTFVASYSSAFDTSSPQTVSVTTQAGDVLVVLAGDAGAVGTYGTPSGNGASFTLQQAVTGSTSVSGANVWTATDSVGGTNWTLSLTFSASITWGFSCLVFRNSAGAGASNKINSSGAPSLAVTTTQANSALVVANFDWAAVDGSSRTWRTINSITPTNGNGLETQYFFSASVYTAYFAYYNDVGATGAQTSGLSAPTGQAYSIVAVEVLGIAPTTPILQTDPVTNVTTTTAQGNGAVNSDGGATVTERGFVWSTSPNPTTSDNKVTASGTTGSYNASLTSLSNGTLYHVRAYAINSVGTGYGIDVTFQNRGAAIAWTGA